MGSYTKKGSYYHYQFYHNGKKHRKSLKTGDLKLAKQLAKAFEISVKKAKSIVELETLKHKQTFAKLDQVSEFYLQVALKRVQAGERMDMHTARRNVRSLKMLVGSLELSSNVLTIQALDKFAQDRLTGIPTSGLTKARNSVESVLKKARSVFSDWALEAYEREGMLLPNLKKWRKYRPVVEDHGTYRLPIERPDLVEKTLNQGAELLAKNDRLATAWLLGYELALRAKESASLKWSWFLKRGDHYGLLIIDRPNEGFKKKGVDREIAVHCDLYDELKRQSKLIAESDSEFVAPGISFNLRYNYIVRELGAFVRSCGFDSEEFEKAGHELRKLKGSQWFSDPALGASVAQEFLGHASIETTCKYYAALIPQKEPPAPTFKKVLT